MGPTGIQSKIQDDPTTPNVTLSVDTTSVTLAVPTANLVIAKDIGSNLMNFTTDQDLIQLIA